MPLLVVHKVGVEPAVVHAIAEYGTAGRDGDDAAPIFYDLDEGRGIERALPLQGLEHVRRPSRNRGRRHEAQRRDKARAQQLLRARQLERADQQHGAGQARHHQRGPDRDQAQTIHQHESGDDGAGGRAQDIGERDLWDLPI
jgi:hypothetical protein